MKVRPLHPHTFCRLGDVLRAAIQSGQQKSPLQVLDDLMFQVLQLVPGMRASAAGAGGLASRISQGRQENSIREPP